MKKLQKLSLIFALIFSLTTKAQVSAYAFTQNTGTYTAISSGTIVASATATTDIGSLDNAVFNLTTGSFPFTFMFNGVGYTGCNISSNGFITFGTTAPLTTNVLPLSSSAAYSGVISAWGGDLTSMYSVGTGSLSGEIRVEVVGIAPNREVVIQYKNWRPAYSTSQTNVYKLNFQIRLQETTNNVIIVYGPMGYVLGSAAITSARQIGLRGTTNTDFNNRTNTSTVKFINAISGTVNSATQTYSTTGTTPAMPIDGLIYKWTPSTACTGVPNAGTATSSTTLFCSAVTTTLNLTGSTSGVTGLNYLWYSSPNGSSWAAIPTATTMLSIQTITATTYFRCAVSCGSNTSTSTAIQITKQGVSASTVPYTEGFEGIINDNDLPNCSWAVSDPLVCLTNTTTGSNNRIPLSGSKFATFKFGTNITGDYFYTNAIQLTAGVKYLAETNYVTDGADGWNQFRILYGTTQTTTGLTSIAAVTGTLNNMTYNNLSGTFSVSTTGPYYLAFKAIGDASPNWYLSMDDISLTVAPVCTTTPLAGSILGPNLVNTNTPNSYTVSPSAGNVQWYKGFSVNGPWNAISGATNNPQNLSESSMGNVYYTVVAKSPGCLSDTANTPLLVNVMLLGDDVCSAIPLTMGASSVKYELSNATVETNEVSPIGTNCTSNTDWCNNNLDNTMWFSFVAPSSGNVSIQSPSFDTQLALWKTNTCNGLLSASTATLIAANDDDVSYSAHGGVQFSSYLTASCLTPGTTYYIQLDSDGAAPYTDSTKIIITDKGALNLAFTGLATSYCMPAATATLTPSLVGGIFTINTSTTAVTEFTPSVAGTYTITYTLGSCGSSSSVTIVKASPTLTLTGTSAPICFGSTATFTIAGASTYTWSPIGGNGTTASFSPTTSTNYTVTGTGTNTCKSKVIASVTVTSASTVSATASTATICSGASVTLTANGATSYTWNPAGSNATTILVTPSITTTYTLFGKTGTCTYSNQITINVNATPTVVTSPSSTNSCIGNSVTLNASGATTYTWNPGALTSVSVIVTPTATTIYTVQGKTGSCSSTKTVMVNVATNVGGSASSNTICSGASSTLSASGSSSYTWMPGGSNSASITVTPTATTIYTVQGQTGSCSSSAQVTVNVSPTLPINITSISNSVCIGSSAVLTANGASNYTWTPSSSNATSIIVTPTTATTYTLQGKTGSCNGITQATIYVNALPIINATTLYNSVCSGASTTLSATGANSYVWSPTNSLNSTTGANVVATPLSNANYSVTGTDINGCVSNTILPTVTIYTMNAITTATNVNCNGACDGSIEITPVGGISPFSYAISQFGFVNCSTSNCLGMCPGIYDTEVTDAHGCVITSSITINEPAQMLTTVTGTNATCGGCADGSANLIITGGVIPYQSFLWSNGATTPGINNIPVGCYTITIRDFNGCEVSDSTCIGFSTGINTLTKENRISVFPNPTSSVITVEISDSNNQPFFEVYDKFGKLVLKEALIKNTSIVNVSHLSEGVYLYKITDRKSSIKTGRLMKQ